MRLLGLVLCALLAIAHPALALVGITGSATGAVTSASFMLQTASPLQGYADVELSGTFTGLTLQLQRLGPDGTTWLNVGSALSTAGLTQLAIGVSAGASYRVSITASTPTGTLVYAVRQ
jgi:hypothetical protein